MDGVAVFEAALDHQRQGVATALETLISRDGSAPRPLGSQMVVTEGGECVGSLTGTGCADNVIVQEACSAIREGVNRTLRLGNGSPYLDIRLPCGTGVDLYIDTRVDSGTLKTLLDEHEARRPIALETDTVACTHRCIAGSPASTLGSGVFRNWIYPCQRLIVVGQGINALALSQIARASGYSVEVFSPDQELLLAAAQAGTDTTRLITADGFVCPTLDAWTAVVIMFHDHDWEMPVLRALQGSHCFYLGALGSRRTQAKRLSALNDSGLTEVAQRLHGPAGLDIGAKAPSEIAISILAEMTSAYRSLGLPFLETATNAKIPSLSSPATTPQSLLREKREQI